MSKTVSKTTYFAADRATRRRIGKELNKLGLGFRLLDERAQKALGRPTPRMELLACADCGQPTPQCTCIDALGNPLVWPLGKRPATVA